MTDRPAPRSSYLFGDEPESPSDRWYHDQPTEQWPPHSQHQAAEPSFGHPTGTEHDHQPRHTHDHAAGHHYRDPAWPGDGHHDISASGHGEYRPDEPTTQFGSGWVNRHHAPVDDRLAVTRAAAVTEPLPVTGVQPSAAAPSRRRLSRPLVLGGAAAAATLVVSIGVAALALPTDQEPTDTTAGERRVATWPALPRAEDPIDALDPPDSPSPSPSASPSTTEPSPSPSPTAKPTPTPARSSTAPSRQGVDRSSSPSPRPSRSATVAPSPSTGINTSQTAQVVELVNAERAKAGCNPLSIDEKLTTAAQQHSQDQADHQNMSHTGSDGSDPADRLDRVGYAWRTYGENVAWNQQTPAAVMDAWMNSAGHRANILNCAFTEIGVGVASSNGPYWTQVFAAPR